jgi:3-dehydroquinate synthase
MRTVWVKPSSGSYPIIIKDSLLKDGITTLTSFIAPGKVAIVTNPELALLYGQALESSLKQQGFDVTLATIPAGESHKTLQSIETLISTLLTQKFERNSTIIALGGGVIGDMAGFAASIILRGIKFIQIPTSLLAQVDAAIGGKTGVNTAIGKNLIGTFYQPQAVLIDPTVLHTLPQRELRSGLAEVVKYGVIQHPNLFASLEQNASFLSQCTTQDNLALWTSLIEISCECKAEVVTKDEKEAGLRETLNFGHTIGHGIETAFNYTRYLHGEAIALGMIAAGRLSVSRNLWPQTCQDRLESLLQTLGFDTQADPINPQEIIAPLANDKKVKNGEIRFILPTKIGSTVTEKIPLPDIEAVLKGLIAHAQ